MEKGMEKLKLEKKEIVKRAFAKGLPIETIMDITNLDMETVTKFRMET